MKKIVGYSLVLLGLAFTSCNNEVDLTGEYKDTPVVYSLLNQNDSVHYIRIQKAFLINGNVLETAKNPDSLKYDPADLVVKIQPLDANSGNPLGSAVTFQYVPGATQDTGIFAQQGIMIYRSTATLNDLRNYRLEITNTKLNKQITAQTGLVHGFVLKKPQTGTIIFNTPSGNGYDLRWLSAVNGFVYQPEIIFHWDEKDMTTQVVTQDSLVWTLTPKEAATEDAGTEMSYILANNSFYQFVGQNVPVKPNVKRKIGPLTFKFYIGTEALNTYINVNKPSIGLIQEKPVYTNVTGGLGLFAGRTVFSKAGFYFHDSAKDTLINSKYTVNLNYVLNF